MKRNGFSLIELLIYMGVLALVSTLFIGILTSTARVQVHEVAATELTNQLNFTLQTLQRLVRESSSIVGSCPNSLNPDCAGDGDNTETLNTEELSYLKLRMPQVTQDPTCISMVNNSTSEVNEIRVTQGPGTNAHECKDSSSADAITTDKVDIFELSFTFNPGSTAPAKDIVQISMIMNSNTQNPQGKISRTVRSAIGRVSAATFDSGLVPSNLNDRNLGTSGTLWEELWVEKIQGQFRQAENYNGTDRGYLIIGASSGTSCLTICEAHADTCAFQGDFVDEGGGSNQAIDLKSCTTAGSNGALCFCS